MLAEVIYLAFPLVVAATAFSFEGGRDLVRCSGSVFLGSFALVVGAPTWGHVVDGIRFSGVVISLRLHGGYF